MVLVEPPKSEKSLEDDAPNRRKEPTEGWDRLSLTVVSGPAQKDEVSGEGLLLNLWQFLLAWSNALGRFGPNEEIRVGFPVRVP